MMEKEINEIIGIKAEIISDLTKIFRENNIRVDIDLSTGALRFSGNILFDSDSEVIQEGFKEDIKEEEY